MRQRLTALSVNAVALLTVGAVVLGLHVSSDRPAGVTKGQYWLGFLLTLAAAALYGLVLPLIELTYKRAAGGGRVVTYALVVEMQLVMGFFATAFCTVGMIVNNDFQVRCPCHSPLSPHSTRSRIGVCHSSFSDACVDLLTSPARGSERTSLY